MVGAGTGCAGNRTAGGTADGTAGGTEEVGRAVGAGSNESSSSTVEEEELLRATAALRGGSAERRDAGAMGHGADRRVDAWSSPSSLMDWCVLGLGVVPAIRVAESELDESQPKVEPPSEQPPHLRIQRPQHCGPLLDPPSPRRIRQETSRCGRGGGGITAITAITARQAGRREEKGESTPITWVVPRSFAGLSIARRSLVRSLVCTSRVVRSFVRSLNRARKKTH